MKIYHISQEVFSCAVHPGDPAPEKQVICSTFFATEVFAQSDIKLIGSEE